MKVCTLALIGLLSLGIQTCNTVHAQLGLSKEDLKSLRMNNGESSSNSIPLGAPQRPPANSARDSDFSRKFNRALSDAERQEQTAQTDSARNQMQHQEMLRGNARSPNRNTDTSKDRAEIQIGEKGATVCRKTESGQTQCEPQGRW